jgi:hypothetical protein
MHTDMNHTRRVRSNQEWASESDLPDWRTPPSNGRFRRRLTRILILLLIAAAMIWSAVDASSSSALTMPSCMTGPPAQLMSIRPSTVPRFRMIPGQPMPPKHCWQRPTDPVNRNLAIRTFHA